MNKRTFKTVELATELAMEVVRMQNLNKTREMIHERVFNWYVNSDVTDICILAGDALCCDYFKNATYNDMIVLAEKFFPVEDPTEDETPIWEIEAAMADTRWYE